MTVDQVIEALVAMKAGLLVDPDHRPDGPIGEDLPSLLAGLLAKVELETAARVQPLAHDDGAAETVAAYLAGWHDVVRVGEADPDALVLEVLANRTERTVVDPDLDHATGGTAQDLGVEVCASTPRPRQYAAPDCLRSASRMALGSLRRSAGGGPGS